MTFSVLGLRNLRNVQVCRRSARPSRCCLVIRLVRMALMMQRPCSIALGSRPTAPAQALLSKRSSHRYVHHPQLLSTHPPIICRSAEITTPAERSAEQTSPPPWQPPPPPPQWRWQESEDAVVAYGTFFALLVFGSLPAVHAIKWVDLPYFIALAVTTIYIGAHRGLTAKSRQQISVKEGALAPVFASISLFGIYTLIKYFPSFSLQTFLNAYFFLIGSIAITGAVQPIMRRISGELGEESIKLDVPKGWLLQEDGVTELTKLVFAPSDVAAVLMGVGLAGAELASGHSNFTLNNLIACLVASEILQLIGLRSFRTAGILLVGLLLYDVFWVFGSPQVIGDNVMLTVATSDLISGPTRLLFPRLPGGAGEASTFPFSLLGLGDVAIPGLLACLALRYDGSRSVDMRSRAAAAAEAIQGALAALGPGASRAAMSDAAANAASDAFDRVADAEVAARDASTSSSSWVGSSPDPGSGAWSRASGSGSSSIPGSSTSSSSSGSGGPSVSANDSGSRGSEVGSSGGANGSSGNKSETEVGQTGAAPVSDAVLHQRVYFTPVIAAYVGGLAMAFAANSITQLGQPALLYIVPCTLAAVVITASTRGELSRLWSYQDVPSFNLPVMPKDEPTTEQHKP